MWEHSHLALRWFNITSVWLKLLLLKVWNYVFSASFLPILGSVGIIALPLSTISWRVSNWDFLEPVLFTAQQNVALVLLILLLSRSVRHCVAERHREGWEDSRIFSSCWLADHVDVSISVPVCVRTGALYKPEPMRWYSSPFKPHLERVCDDLLKILRFFFSLVFILSCSNTVCQIKTDALIKTQYK